MILALHGLLSKYNQIAKKRYDAKLVGDILHVGLVHDGKKCILNFKEVYKKGV